MASFDSLTDLELRNKLLEFGYDLPVSPQNRDLLLRKLKSVSSKEQDKKELGRRKSAGRTPNAAVDKEASEARLANVLAKTRLSFNDQGFSKQRPSGGVLNRVSSVPVQRKKIAENNGNDSGQDDDEDEGVDVADVLPPTRSLPIPSSPPRFSTKRLADTRVTTSQTSNSKNHLSSFDNNESVERQERFANYLNLLRDDAVISRRSEQSFSRRRESTGRYNSYSEDESDDEILEVAPSKFQKFRSFINPTTWIKKFNFKKRTTNQADLSVSPVDSTSTLHSSRFRGSSTVGFNNGHSAGNRNLLTRTKRYLGNMFEDKVNVNVVRRENETTHDGSSNVSKYLVLSLIGFFVVVAACYFNIKGNPGLTGPSLTSTVVPVNANRASSGSGGNYPICGMDGITSSGCIEKDQVKICRTLFLLLKGELAERAKWKGCTTTEDKVTLDKAKEMLFRLSDYKKHEVDDAYRGMLLLCIENPKWGLMIQDSDDNVIESSSDLNLVSFHEVTISAKDIAPHIFCQFWSGFYLVLYYAVLLAFVAFAAYLVFKIGKYIHGRKKREENETFELVEQILEVLFQQYEKSRDTGCEPFLAVNHIRDEMVPPKEKQSKAALWNKAVKYISDHESRIREEIQHISGEEFRVWRWLPGASPLTSQRKSLLASHSPAHLPALTSTNSANKWQGQAFEMSEKGPNSVPVTPTTCLKIRHMWDVNSGSPEQLQGKVEQAILEKCSGTAILHIGIDPMSPDGCAYVKCATKEDARTAYFDLHGWWFEGHLLSVKFLREERYLTRFPTARGRTARMHLQSSEQKVGGLRKY